METGCPDSIDLQLLGEFADIPGKDISSKFSSVGNTLNMLS